jgi:hypothetical protein
MNSLASLYLQTNSFTGTIPAGLMQLTTLLDLRLSDNRLTGPIPPDLAELTRLGKCLWRTFVPLPVAIAIALLPVLFGAQKFCI